MVISSDLYALATAIEWFDMKTDWRELEGIKPRWDNQVHLLDELLANVNNFNLSHEVEGIIHVFWIVQLGQLSFSVDFFWLVTYVARSFITKHRIMQYV